jgi:hypothetical protein
VKRIALLAVVLTACASATTALNSGLVAVEGDQERQCVDRYSPDAAAERECRAGVTATWDHYWASRYPDAGLWEGGNNE